MNPVTQPSRLRVRAASRRAKEHGAGRPVNSQAGTPAPTTAASAQEFNARNVLSGDLILAGSPRLVSTFRVTDAPKHAKAWTPNAHGSLNETVRKRLSRQMD